MNGYLVRLLTVVSRDWWFASTAIPLLAATLGPMANVMSIAALVTSWRSHVVQPEPVVTSESTSVGYKDPHWCVALNIASLVCGFVGNLFLLFNFTKAVRYIIALPATIILWYIATGILMSITICMNKFAPPSERDVYSQGFWHAVIAACLYMFSSVALGINMLGYFLGHYPQHFTLTDDQRNLILQTMMFFAWLAMGGAVFSNILPWSFVDALYFCDVTILTVGFGDLYATNDLARGLVFPYSVGGIIILGLMVSSIHRFAGELGQDKIVAKHVDRRRRKTIKRTLTLPVDDALGDAEKQLHINNGRPLSISQPTNPRPIERRSQIRSVSKENSSGSRELRITKKRSPPRNAFHKTFKVIRAPAKRIRKARNQNSKVLVMREERDRFNAMRDIQGATSRFKKWYALSMSVTAFGILWCVGAIGFWQAEQRTQQMTYFQALYFCYVSLLTIGYGDLSPKSNAGKPFFILWSLIAVPTMTILISDMGDTIIASFKRGTFIFADFTVMPKKGIYRAFMLRNPWLWNWLQRKAEKKRVEHGFEAGFDEADYTVPSLNELAGVENLTEGELTRKLAFAIRRTADDLMKRNVKRYSYEDWVEFTRLIRFTSGGATHLEEDEEEHGVVEWDWIGEDSPMLSDQSETEWVLDRLCESLLRLLKKGHAQDLQGEASGDVATPRRLGASGSLKSSHSDYNQWHGCDDKGSGSDSNNFDGVAEGVFKKSRRSLSQRRKSSAIRLPRQESHQSVDPMHRGIGLYPELDTSPLESPGPEAVTPNERPVIVDRRRSSGIASGRSGNGLLEPGRDTRRRSSRSPRAVSASGRTSRRGPFSALPSARRSESSFSTLKHKMYVRQGQPQGHL